MTDIAKQRIVFLIGKFLNEELSDEERKELDAWTAESQTNKRIFEKLTDTEDWVQMLREEYNFRPVENTKIRLEQLIEFGRPKRQAGIWSMWIRFSMAAAAVVALVISGYFLLQPRKPQPVAKTEQKPVINDKAPGRDGAILKLANGQEIVLDNAANGNLAQQGSTSITKSGNVLAYNGAHGNGNEVLYNTLSTPVGRKFQLVLPDGTRAWLNAQSSITYPTAFTGKERNVTVKGEVYMEVAKDASKPFKAHVISPVSGMEESIVQVLGTHFNINGYGDEIPVKTTLLEGKVKVTEGNAVALLKPGQQAQIEVNGIDVKSGADVDKETAWKNDLFSFKNDKIKNIMPQIARWYDVDVVYEGSNVQNIGITGEIERSANLSEVLKLLSFININYQLEGRKLILKD